MKKIKDLQDTQDILDEEIVPCPKCGKEEKWGYIREWGDCNECVGDEMRKNNTK